MDRLLNMILHRVMRQVVNRGVDAGVRAATRRGRGAQDAPAPAQADRRQTGNMLMRIANRLTRL